MTEHQEAAHVQHAGPDGLWRWLLGGLAGGGIILGLLIAAYAMGYHRGRHHPHGTAPAAAATAPPTTSSTTAAATTAATHPATPTPIPSTPALIARGKTIYEADGCGGCHSLTGSPGAGPSLKGLAGSTVTLTGGQTVTADDAYLEQSIADPDAQIVKGYGTGIMSAAVASRDLAAKPDQIRALVAFIKSQK
jgi:mono/diheme cytochrome c family protein